ncbi:cupin domain-containing protein [Streptomyces longisporus]|uniref:AraC-type arabinose-binding/dimerisation domain-containing protein n=1 Tax=Streptomyces longisporus TaxID=1948 RepID=A0ABN3LSM7_STRLO
MSKAERQVGRKAEAAMPLILGNTDALSATASSETAVLWKLAESGRQLDANVVRLTPGRHIAPHAEPDLDVLVLVVAGDGVLGAGPQDEPQSLNTGTLLWLPHGSTRSITAGDDGLAYLTVHRRRPGLQIGQAPRDRTAQDR